ncbi:MAG: hypothetical protein QOC63_4795 [Mycobacterium sp.]|jgi:hypothetical protein|nr:hypothetical protein [Mycobacterium sp.]
MSAVLEWIRDILPYPLLMPRAHAWHVVGALSAWAANDQLERDT